MGSLDLLFGGLTLAAEFMFLFENLIRFRCYVSIMYTLTGFEITKKNHCDRDIFEHSFRL